ncbi:hypothetical protein JHK84_048895 [Glycine max]|nr:hypothetical protein JHK84_048895 [Glycine max]
MPPFGTSSPPSWESLEELPPFPPASPISAANPSSASMSCSTCQKNWECEPKSFELGNHDGATVQIGSSLRFPM